MAGAAYANPFTAKTTPTNAKVEYNANSSPKLEIATDVEVGEITNYSLRFKTCQVVKSYFQDELAEEGASNVLSISRFVLFRFYPSDICSNSCHYNYYSEYMVDMDKYLKIATDYQGARNTCGETCNNNTYYNDDAEEEADDGDDADGELRKLAMSVECDICQSECRQSENMEANYYLDATSFIKCQQIEEDDGYNGALYAGPICVSQGTKIKIGVFKD